MADFRINGADYQSRLMDGETQTLVLKRLLPTVTALFGCRSALGTIKADVKAPAVMADEAAGDDRDSRVQDMLMPVARELAGLPDADVSFILTACLDVTKRLVTTGGGGWVDVRQRGIVQDQTDAKFITRLTIAWHVLGENFGEMLASFGLDIETLQQAAPKLG